MNPAVLPGVSVWSLTATAAAVAFVASLLIGPGGIGLPGNGEVAHLILTEIRLPRAILGFLIGGALGLSGAVLQGYLRNALAEPGLLGVTGGASLLHERRTKLATSAISRSLNRSANAGIESIVAMPAGWCGLPPLRMM